MSRNPDTPDRRSILESLGIEDVNPGGFDGEWLGSGTDNEVITPIDGSHIATVQQVTEDEYDLQFADIFDQIAAYAAGSPINVINPEALGR